MPRLEYQVSVNDRWAIVAYVRVLQRMSSGSIETFRRNAQSRPTQIDAAAADLRRRFRRRGRSGSGRTARPSTRSGEITMQHSKTSTTLSISKRASGSAAATCSCSPCWSRSLLCGFAYHGPRAFHAVATWWRSRSGMTIILGGTFFVMVQYLTGRPGAYRSPLHGKHHGSHPGGRCCCSFPSRSASRDSVRVDAGGSACANRRCCSQGGVSTGRCSCCGPSFTSRCGVSSPSASGATSTKQDHDEID